MMAMTITHSSSQNNSNNAPSIPLITASEKEKGAGANAGPVVRTIRPGAVRLD